MKVIGVVGRIGSGKDVTVKYLHARCGVPLLSIGNLVREVAHEEGVTLTRENLHTLSERYMARHGDDIFVQKLISRIEASSWDVAGITGIRTPTDVDALRAHFGDDFFLAYVEVSDPEIRFRRLKARGEPRDPKTYEAFIAQDLEEEEQFHIGEAIARADATLNNDGTLEDLHRQTDRVLVRGVLKDTTNCNPEDR